MDAEKGKGSTSSAVYFALLWAYDLLDPIRGIADPALDIEGLNLSLLKERARSRVTDDLDNEF